MKCATAGNVCRNGGICVDTEETRLNGLISYKCQCTEQWTGNLCEKSKLKQYFSSKKIGFN